MSQSWSSRARLAFAAFAALAAACNDPTTAPEPGPPPVDNGASAYVATALGSGTLHATDINELGQVLVTVSAGGERVTAAIWQDGVVTRLSTAPDATVPATAINDLGQVVGWSFPVFRQSFRWDPGAGFTVLEMPAGFTLAAAQDINNAGEIVGWGDLASGHRRALYWDASGEVRDLGTLGGSSSAAEGISQSGLVVGTSSLANGQSRGFIWRADIGMLALDPLPGASSSRAFAINDRCEIIGQSDGVPVIWRLGTGPTPTALPTIPGLGPHVPEDINNAGQVVGRTDVIRAVVWDLRAGTITELPSPPGHSVSQATAINDAGLIVGISFIRGGGGATNATIWRPQAAPLLSMCP